MRWSAVQQVRCADMDGVMNQPIPKLDDLLTLVKPTSMKLVIEVKKYSGQSTASLESRSAATAKRIVAYGLTSRARMSSFAWAIAGPAAKKISTSIHFTALDTTPSLDRVRRAKALHLNGYSLYTSKAYVFFMQHIKKRGMSCELMRPITTSDFNYGYSQCGPSTYTDYPIAVQNRLQTPYADVLAAQQMVYGARDPYLLLDSYLYKGTRVWKTAVGTAVPTADLSRLGRVRLQVTITKGAGLGSLILTPNDSAGEGAVRIPMPVGSSTTIVNVSPGDSGKIRFLTDRESAHVKAVVIGYERQQTTGITTFDVPLPESWDEPVT